MRELCGISTVLRELCGMKTTARRGWPHPVSAVRSKQKEFSMSEEYMRLREKFESVAAEGKEYLKRLRSAPILGLRWADSAWECLDCTDRETADRVRGQLCALAAPLYEHVAASPMLGPPDHRSFGDHLRTMDAALKLRTLRPRRRKERCLSPIDAERQFTEAHRAVLDLLEFVPANV